MSDELTTKSASGRVRPAFPKRAVITAGMPYGSKDLHFGHVGASCLRRHVRRFLRPHRARNVLFISGTDCYGSPIIEEHRKQTESDRFRSLEVRSL